MKESVIVLLGTEGTRTCKQSEIRTFSRDPSTGLLIQELGEAEFDSTGSL
jgi:hypothetical protein